MYTHVYICIYTERDLQIHMCTCTSRHVSLYVYMYIHAYMHGYHACASVLAYWKVCS